MKQSNRNFNKVSSKQIGNFNKVSSKQINIIHGILSVIGIIGLVFIGYSLAPTKTETITNTIIKTVVINYSQSNNNINEIPAWVKWLNPENPDAQIIIDLYEMNNHFFIWENHKPAIGKIQSICGENKECLFDFGYEI